MLHIPIAVLIALEQQRIKAQEQRPALQLPLYHPLPMMEEIREEEKEEENPRGVCIIPMW